ncbi:MAG: TlyA family RNA methyltransferase [Candidatus Aminicenantes bacterium]|nr:TlyA family RNA methyltransferase [Candidatus Aminicenantes bacterium]
MRERADKILVNRGLVGSRQKAQALIMEGLAFSNNIRIDKPGQMLSLDQEIFLKKKLPFVGRGGLKLASVLDQLKLKVKDIISADLGASTGGFVDCLLQRGAKKVYAVDVDTRQIDCKLREDPRVILIEKNARYLSEDDFKDDLDLVTMDLSFISVLKVIPAVKSFLGKGELLVLIKPQFEAGRHQVGKKGVVRDSSVHKEVLEKIIKETERLGFSVIALVKSQVLGQKGNQEFFLHCSLNKSKKDREKIKGMILEVIGGDRN